MRGARVAGGCGAGRRFAFIAVSLSSPKEEADCRLPIVIRLAGFGWILR